MKAAGKQRQDPPTAREIEARRARLMAAARGALASELGAETVVESILTGEQHERLLLRQLQREGRLTEGRHAVLNSCRSSLARLYRAIGLLDSRRAPRKRARASIWKD